jgi:hypothetical protein
MPAARAVDLGDGKFSLNGYGSVAYMRTNGNAYVLGTQEGGYDNVDMAILLTVKPTDDVAILTQFTIASPQEASVDFAFGEWRPSDLLRLRFGKIKQPIGIYNEIFDVGTVRPFFSLPSAIYGPAGITTEAYFGVGATGAFDLKGAGEGWNLAYDLYGGNATMAVFEPFEAAATPGAPIGEEEEIATRDMIGARLIANAPVDGLDFRLSGFRGRRPDATLVVYGLSVEYLSDRLWARAELFRELELDQHTSNAGYVELGYFLTPHWQVAGRLEGSWISGSDTPSDSSTNHHREAAVGLNYWFNRQLVLKASVHGVDGNRFATPGAGAIASDPLPTQTTLYVVGTQFSF